MQDLRVGGFCGGRFWGRMSMNNYFKSIAEVMRDTTIVEAIE